MQIGKWIRKKQMWKKKNTSVLNGKHFSHKITLFSAELQCMYESQLTTTTKRSRGSIHYMKAKKSINAHDICKKKNCYLRLTEKIKCLETKYRQLTKVWNGVIVCFIGLTRHRTGVLKPQGTFSQSSSPGIVGTTVITVIQCRRASMIRRLPISHCVSMAVWYQNESTEQCIKKETN